MNLKLIVPLALALAATGCASIVEGTDQSVTVSSNPTEASCLLEREGAQIGAVNPTPGSVLVGKSSADITVTCSKAGYSDGVAVLASNFEGMTLGNIIFGGIVGVGVDAASGAMHTYPPAVTVTLPPK